MKGLNRRLEKINWSDIRFLKNKSKLKKSLNSTTVTKLSWNFRRLIYCIPASESKVFAEVEWEMLFLRVSRRSQVPRHPPRSSQGIVAAPSKVVVFFFHFLCVDIQHGGAGVTYQQLTVIGPSTPRRRRIDIDFLISYYWTENRKRRSWRERSISMATTTNQTGLEGFSSGWITQPKKKENLVDWTQIQLTKSLRNPWRHTQVHLSDIL